MQFNYVAGKIEMKEKKRLKEKKKEKMKEKY